jgi:hypothetical protein
MSKLFSVPAVLTSGHLTISNPDGEIVSVGGVFKRELNDGRPGQVAL